MPLVLVTPPQTSPRELALVEKMFKAGLQRLHVRKPDLPRESHAAYLAAIPDEFKDRVVLHDYHDLADELELGGIHYRQRQIPSERIVAPPRRTVSLGFHRPQYMRDDRGEVDYCFLSPIYQSISKEGYCPPPELMDREILIQRIKDSHQPVFALGGVRPESFSELADWGFSGAALLGAVWDAKDPLAALDAALEADARTPWNTPSKWPFFTSCLASVDRVFVRLEMAD